MDTIPQDTPQKQCSVCGKWKPATSNFFYAAPDGKYGVNSRCRICTRLKWRAEHPNAKPRKVGDSLVPDGFKRCVSCEKDLPATPLYFYADARNKDGLRSRCKECLKIYNQSRIEIIRAFRQRNYQQHKEEIKQRAQQYARLHKEKYQEYYRVYGLTRRDRDKVRAWQRLYRQAHRDFINARARELRPRYRDNIRTKDRNRRAIEKAVPGKHTSAQIQELYRRQHKKCYYCGQKVAWREHHVDHTFPLSRVAGTDIPANDISYLVITCPTCNLKKHNKFPWEWPEGGRLL